MRLFKKGGKDLKGKSVEVNLSMSINQKIDIKDELIDYYNDMWFNDKQEEEEEQYLSKHNKEDRHDMSHRELTKMSTEMDKRREKFVENRIKNITDEDVAEYFQNFYESESDMISQFFDIYSVEDENIDVSINLANPMKKIVEKITSDDDDGDGEHLKDEPECENTSAPETIRVMTRG